MSVAFARTACWDEDGYTGTISKTKSGRNCKKWNSVSVQYTDSLYYAPKRDENHNYCRSTSGKKIGFSGTLFWP